MKSILKFIFFPRSNFLIMKYEGVALFISLIVLNDEVHNGLVASQFNNPTFFMIGGVFSNNDSKEYFKRTLNVSNIQWKPSYNLIFLYKTFLLVNFLFKIVMSET